MPHVRFDDLTPGAEHAFEFDDLVDVVVATEPRDVVGALLAVESATAQGMWAAGYVAYEAACGLDESLTVRPGETAVPLVWFGLFGGRHDVPPVTPRMMRPAPYHVSVWRSEVERPDYIRRVDAIRDHIAAGDTYQVNYTFRLNAAFSGETIELYRDLALAQRGAFSAYLDMGRHTIVSASPELFFAQRGARIEVGPMKGTVRRGRWAAEDRIRAAELAASGKDRAENLMIVDLLRNDLGRIAEFGSVEVDELFALERYETVWQLTSLISATLRPDIGLAGIFSALFPSGSVTGAPKPRTMELIADLETTRRGVYCGAVGYIAPGPAATRHAAFNVAIRTVTVDRIEGTAEYGVGGGITWDSRSDAEYEEARLKAQLLAERRPEFSLLETIRWDPSHGFSWLDHHLERMTASAEYFGFVVDRARMLAAVVDAVAGSVAPSRIRMVLRRSGRVEASAMVRGARFHDGPDDPGPVLTFAVDTEPVSSHNVFLFHKTTRRDVYDERLKRHPHADDVILVNERAEVTEFSIGNLAVRFDGRWWTPPLESGCLPGVYRSVLLDRGVITERPITLTDLADGDAVAFLNSVQGWRPAVPVG